MMVMITTSVVLSGAKDDKRIAHDDRGCARDDCGDGPANARGRD